MKRNMIVLLAFFISVIMLSTPVYAVDTTGRFYIGLFGGGAIPISGPLDEWKEEISGYTVYPYSSEASAMTGVGGIEGFYGIDKNLSIGLSLSRRQTDIDYERIGTTEKWSESITTYTLMPLIQLRAPASEIFTPYLNFGLGININDVMENFLAIKIGGGMDYFITEDISLNINADWFYNTAKAKTERSGIPAGDVDLNSVQILFGVRYFFPADN